MTNVDVIYNPFEPGHAEDPYRQYTALREHNPVFESPFGIWMLFAHDDVLRFLRDPYLSVNAANAGPTMLDALVEEAVGPEPRDRGDRAMLNVDAPDHTRLRRLVSRAFTPRAIEALRPRVQQLVDDALDQGATDDGLDLIPALAFPLPFMVISEMLGLPETDQDQLREWSGTLVRALEPVVDADLLRAIAAAGDNMRGLVTEMIAWKRENPADDMLSDLIAAEEGGDKLTELELLDQVMLLFIAGHETTVNLIGNGTLALLRHRGQLERLIADPSLDAPTIEELLRYDSPVQATRRITLQDVEVGGKSIPAGTFVMLSLASANRDESRWGSDADAVDLGRDDASQHLSFGGGAHHCLGAALARLEGQVAIGTLVRRYPRLELAGEPTWNGRINLRGLDSLPLALA